MNTLDGKRILVTGGTGSFGKHFIKTVLQNYKPEKIVVFSRDEMKQYEMQKELPAGKTLRYFIGDIRDRSRLHRAFHGIDIVVHAAAMKIITVGEHNPMEVINTNVLGAENIIHEAIDQKVSQVIALSTDKAVNPINLYGASKLAAEKLFIAANVYSGEAKTKFSSVRYGNVINSRGSVIPFWKEKMKTGKIPITDKRMTRFFVTLDQVVSYVVRFIDIMQGGEVFIPKLPSMKIMDLAKAIAPNCEYEFTGIREGEKIHEILISEDESHHCVDFKDHYLLAPEFLNDIVVEDYSNYKKMKEGFKYSSNNNTQWIDSEEIRKMI